MFFFEAEPSGRYADRFDAPKEEDRQAVKEKYKERVINYILFKDKISEIGPVPDDYIKDTIDAARSLDFHDLEVR